MNDIYSLVTQKYYELNELITRVELKIQKNHTDFMKIVDEKRDAISGSRSPLEKIRCASTGETKELDKRRV